MITKKFHLGDILSITTDQLVSPSRMGGVYNILNFMTGHDLMTHLLPHAIEECQSYLLDAMPWLKEIDTSGLNEENYEEWMDEMIKKYGEYHDVSPIPSNTTDPT
ncbi:MAG: hypothetical protein ACD_13C00045G0002 [uncultured bacterium]|nr:MAG: hypothetical protein ACD_13C00045G0002 [uncultured bacterium]